MIFFTKFGDGFCESPNLVTNIVTILVSFFKTRNSGKYGETLTVSLTVKRHFYTSQHLSSGKVNPVVISGGAPFTKVKIFWRRSFLVQTLPNAQRTQGIEYFDSFKNLSSRQKLQQALKSLVDCPTQLICTCIFICCVP